MVADSPSARSQCSASPAELVMHGNTPKMSKTPAADGDAKQPHLEGDLFESDAFRLFCFKILPCSKRFVHDWPSCPFAHPGEKAKRRDPRTHVYDCEMCPAVTRGETCELGAACPHSHHVFESWLHPQKYRTLLCKDGDSCHREVCFFAHGTKQLRTPDRSYQQRQQQHHHHAADGSRGKQQQHHSPSASQRSSFERNQRSSSNSRPSGGQQQLQQQYVASDGSSTAAGTNTLMQQMQGGQAFNACAGAPTSHPMLPVGGLQLDDSSMQAQLQLAAAAGNNGGAAAKADLLHLVQTLMAQVSASQHEAAESTRAAVAAQHKLQLLENLFGSSDSSGFSGAVLGAAQNGPSLSPQVSPDAAMRSAGDWHTPAGGSVASASTPLPQLQPMLLQGAGYDNPLCPRRHSVDEILLRRAHGNNPGAMGGGGFGRNAPMWGANLQQQRPLSSLTEGVPAGVMRTVSGPSAASSDIEALAAAFAGAGLDLQSPGALGSMQPAGGGLVVGADAAALTSAAAAAAQLSGNSTSASSNAWLGMGCMQAAAPAAAGVSWAPAPTPALGAGGGGFNSFSHLPPIPTNYQQPGMMGSNSISAPQLQSDYLLHLHSLLQGGSTGVMHAGACAPRPPVRASFDTAAAYLPPLGGDLLGGEGLGRTPSGAAAGCGGSGGAGADMFAAAADDAAAASGSGSGSVHHSNGSPASSVQASVCVPDKLRNNPIGGAKQLGWF